uniref:Uncharacterized protein n=1 Tax=Gouania willdenowi TaxID=441366 RepID=A0A8C5G6P2_GOUWI
MVFEPYLTLMIVFLFLHSASGASVVAIDNKIEQAMDLVKSHLMYAVREEVEVMKEQIKELYERNSVLERENAVLKSLANSEQLNQLSSQLSHGSTSPPPAAPPGSWVGGAAISRLEELLSLSGGVQNQSLAFFFFKEKKKLHQTLVM